MRQGMKCHVDAFISGTVYLQVVTTSFYPERENISISLVHIMLDIINGGLVHGQHSHEFPVAIAFALPNIR
jgi:hypothetical protein